MKRISLLAIVGIFLLGTQTKAGDLIAFGLKGGIANTWVRSDLSSINDDNSPLLGWQAGAYARVNLPIIMGVKGELLYTKKGYDFSNAGVDSEVRADYVEIPLLLSFGIIGKIELDIGPQFSFRVSESYSDNSGAGFTYDEVYQDLPTTEIGLAIGADVNIIKRLGAYARYTYGFDNSFKVLGLSDQTVGQNTFQLGVKIRIMN